MKFKSVFVLLIFCALWAGAFVQTSTFAPKKKWDDRTFFRAGTFEIPALAVETREIEVAIEKSFILVKTLKSVGYVFRELATQLPKWMFIQNDRLNPGKRQVLLREEVADEFEGQNSKEVYRVGVSALKQHADSIFADKNPRLYFLFIPTKVFANSVPVNLADARSIDVETFGLTEGAVRVGSEANQRFAEREVQKRRVKSLSLLSTYLKWRDTHYPLYPYGQSHWSRVIIEKAGLELVTQISDDKSIARDCFDLTPKLPATLGLSEKHYGDLATNTGIPADSFLGERMSTMTLPDRISQNVPKTFSEKCPVIHFVGTSYGEFYLGHGDITQSMQLHYKGQISNHSATGSNDGYGPLHFMKSFDASIIGPGSIVIWEMPFRFLKAMRIEDGKPVFWPDGKPQ